ncbi:hypothetical protein O9H85_10235 [Paenibacillus filicis]|uniref:Uncharacterized protein n=1 Tax=Paenibacillus gyeongsangnamensis TaxID=3388067 RepID=A0ABT4Q7E0_9BACL|nr:hypothetical protein [Paenibacillus filicis]MCZ8512786.1 hypothetical protein [Paenibacillus filicis]
MNLTDGYHASSDSQTITTFRALVEAIIPNTPISASYGPEQSAGALELGVHEYMIWELNHSLSLFVGYYLAEIPLAASTAMLLNDGAAQYIASGKAQDPQFFAVWRGSSFASLSPRDRIRVLAMLEQLDVDLGTLPPPYRNDGGLITFIVDFLNRGPMFGFYSEWSAYGSTRLKTPTERRLEYFPISWKQAGYPGVSKGYRALRGFLLKIDRKDGGASNG